MYRVILVCLLLLVWGVGFSNAADLESKEHFTKDYVEALRAAHPELTVEVVHPMELKVKAKDGHELSTFLDNAYDSYKQDPKAKADVIKRYVATAVESLTVMKNDTALEPAHIVPIVKDRAWLAEATKTTQSLGAKKPPDFVLEDLNPDLVILYAEDSEKSIHYLHESDLAAAKIDHAGLRELACKNLLKMLPKIESHGGEGIYILTAGGTYEASLLLIDSIWTGGQLEVKGETVVAVPARDMLIVTGSKDADGLERMGKIVDDATKAGSYRLTPKRFVYRNGKWVEFKEAKP